MSAYNAPVEDMLFAMTSIANLDDFVSISGNEDVSSENVKLLIEEAGKVCERKIR